MGFLRRSKRSSDRPSPSSGGSSNQGLFSRLFGRKANIHGTQAKRESTIKRRSVRVNATAAPSALLEPPKAPPVTPATPAVSTSPTPIGAPAINTSVNGGNSNVNSSAPPSAFKSADANGEKGGLFGLIRKRSNLSLRRSKRESVQGLPSAASTPADSSGANGWTTPTGRLASAPLYDKLASTPLSDTSLSPPSEAARASTMRAPAPPRASIIPDGADADAAPPLPPKSATIGRSAAPALAAAVAAEKETTEAEGSPIPEDTSYVRATSPLPRPAAALETLEMSAPLSMGKSVSLGRTPSLSAPGRSVNASVTTVTTTAASEMIITPSPVDQAEAAATDAPVPNNQATSLESPELVIPAPVGLTVEYMPGSPVTPEIAKSEDRVGTTGIASAATAGAVAAAAIAATDDTEDLQDAPAVTAKSPAASALAPPISLPSSTEVVTEEDTAVSTVDEAPASPKAADTVVVEAPEAQDDESVVKPSEPEPETAKAPIVPAIVTAEPVSKNASEEPATPVQEPAEQPSARTPPPVTTTVLLSPESPSLDDHKQAISTPTAPLESFMSNAPVDDVKEPLVGKQPLVEEAKVPLDDVKSDLEDVKAEIGAEIPDSPSASMEEAIAKETIATLPVLPSINVGSTYKIVSDDALTPPLSPLDSPIVTAEFKAATEISPVPAAPPKDDVPSNHNGVPRENAPATPTPRTPSVGTATAALATMTVDANDGSEAPPVPEKLAAPVQAKLASPSSTPQKADTLTPRRVSKAGLNGDGSPSSFRSSPRTVSGPATPGSPGTDPTLDDFMGLFKTVIGRDKSMTIREAARKAEDRPVA